MNASHDCRPLLMAELLGRPALTHAAADPMRPLIASLLAGRSIRQRVLPATLGLSTDTFQTLWDDYFLGEQLSLTHGDGQDVAELDDLLNLLLEYRAGLRESEVWAAHIVAYACCGRKHLWQDLGLRDQDELSVVQRMRRPCQMFCTRGINSP